MERINVLNSNQLSKELQTYNRYKNKTQKEIKERIGSTKDLRKELLRLENKYKITKTFNIGGQNYTENELIMMIDHYYKTTVKTPQLIPDTLKEIMYYADINTINQYCSTNKEAQLLCHDVTFWKMKFYKQNLPLLYEINKENIKLLSNDIKKEAIKYIINEPTSWKEWKQLYIDTINYIQIANKFVKNVISTRNFEQFYTPEIMYYQCLWLPIEWFQLIKNLDDGHLMFTPFIQYNIYNINKKNKNIEYQITLHIESQFSDNPENSEEVLKLFDVDDKIYTLNLPQEQYILYLAKLFYNHKNFNTKEIFLLNDEYEESIFSKDLKLKATQNIKKVFPNW